MRQYLIGALALTCWACGNGNAAGVNNAALPSNSGGAQDSSGGAQDSSGGAQDSGSGAQNASGGAQSAGGGALNTSGSAGSSPTGSGGGTATSTVVVEPPTVFLDPGATQTFTCTVVGATSNAGCTWSVVGGASNGTITADGTYTAPSTLGVAQVQATPKSDPTLKGSAIATVKSVTVGTPGTWENVTPRNMNLDYTAWKNDNFGVLEVVVDPMRPSDLYAFVCHQGVWKSTDYGATWNGPINTGPGGDKVTAGKPWTAAIDLGTRDPSTPPTIWTTAGNAAVGVLRSTDGGVSWTAFETKNSTAVTSAQNNDYYKNDAYSLNMDPYDNKHLIVGFHSGGLSESTNSGETWTTIAVPDGLGGSVYPFFIDTGDAATTRGNWVTIAQSGSNNGTWHTTDGGKAWTKVADFMHGHGGTQLLSVGKNVAYAGGDSAGVFKTTDGGAHWTNIAKTGSNSVFATPTKIYSTYAWASGSAAVDPGLQSASRDADTAWKVTPTPKGMTNGAKYVAVTSDGTHSILVGAFWNAGIFRYVE